MTDGLCGARTNLDIERAGRRVPGTAATMTVIPDTEDKVINAELSYAGLEVSGCANPDPSRSPSPTRYPKMGTTDPLIPPRR